VYGRASVVGWNTRRIYSGLKAYAGHIHDMRMGANDLGLGDIGDVAAGAIDTSKLPHRLFDCDVVWSPGDDESLDWGNAFMKFSCARAVELVLERERTARLGFSALIFRSRDRTAHMLKAQMLEDRLERCMTSGPCTFHLRHLGSAHESVHSKRYAGHQPRRQVPESAAKVPKKTVVRFSSYPALLRNIVDGHVRREPGCAPLHVNDALFLPYASNLESIDGFCREALLQVTVSQSHDVKSAGLGAAAAAHREIYGTALCAGGHVEVRTDAAGVGRWVPAVVVEPMVRGGCCTVQMCSIDATKTVLCASVRSVVPLWFFTIESQYASFPLQKIVTNKSKAKSAAAAAAAAAAAEVVAEFADLSVGAAAAATSTAACSTTTTACSEGSTDAVKTNQCGAVDMYAAWCPSVDHAVLAIADDSVPGAASMAATARPFAPPPPPHGQRPSQEDRGATGTA